MPDAAVEIVYTGVGRFVQEQIIALHTPEAHYQKIMQKYFWVTERLEGQSLELAQYLRPQVELAARAAGWSKTLVEGFIVGQAAAFMMFLGYRGFKSAAEVFGGMARRHGSTMPESRSFESVSSIALLAAPTSSTRPGGVVRRNRKDVETPDVILGPATSAAGQSTLNSDVPAHLTGARFAGFAEVTARIRGDGRETRPPPSAKPRSADVPRLHALADLRKIAHHEVMGTVGVEAAQFGGYLKEYFTGLPDDQRRHAQRAYVYMLQGLLSKDAKSSSGSTDPREAFLAALAATKTRGEGLSDANIDRVFQALLKYNRKKVID